MGLIISMDVEEYENERAGFKNEIAALSNAKALLQAILREQKAKLKDARRELEEWRAGNRGVITKEQRDRWHYRARQRIRLQKAYRASQEVIRRLYRRKQAGRAAPGFYRFDISSRRNVLYLYNTETGEIYPAKTPCRAALNDIGQEW